MKNPKSFDDFKNLAKQKSLSLAKKVDFPDRKTSIQVEDIICDWHNKLSDLSYPKKIVLDIGCGCLLVNRLFMSLEEASKLLLVDSQEMLDNVKLSEGVEKFPGKFPDVPNLFGKYKEQIDIIIANSVIQYIYAEGYPVLFKFIDRALELLKPGGRLLLSDIPNYSKAKRFFDSRAGKEFHKKKNKTNKNPMVKLTAKDIDDTIILDILDKYRYLGFDVYVLPQSKELLFSNRREDILIVKN